MRFWYRRYCVLLLVMIALLAWFSIMYGVVLGSIICGKSNINMHFNVVNIPGIHRQCQIQQHGTFLKVF